MQSSFSKSNHSNPHLSGFAFILAVTFGWCAIAESQAQVVIVAPNALTTTDGDTSRTAPTGDSAQRAMRIFDASQFGALSGPSLLTQFAFRPDAIAGPSGPRTGTLRIYVSTTSRSPAQMSTTFSENIGTNNTLVFDGTVTLSTEDLSGPGNTRLFDIVYPFTTPFLYDPAAGNLSLDVQTSSGSGQSLRWDAVTAGPSAPMRTVVALESPTATSGNFSDIFSVHEFTFVAPAQVTIRTSQVEVCWNTRSNVSYQVEYSSSLTPSIWTPTGDCIRSANSTTCAYFPIIVGQPQRFYRVVLSNCVP